MCLVDDRAIPRDSRWAVAAPGEGLVNDHRLRHRRCRVTVVADKVEARVADLVAKELVSPADRPGDRFGIGVEEQLGAVETVPVLRCPRTVHSVAVQRARTRLGQIRVPDMVGRPGHLDANGLDGVFIVEYAELYGRRVLGEQCEVHAFAVPRRPDRMGATRPDADGNRSSPGGGN